MPSSQCPVKFSRRNNSPHLVQLVPQDDPSLLPPQPLILDPQLRFPLSARILSEWNNSRDSRDSRDDRNDRDVRGPAVVRQPWIVCGDSVPTQRREQVERAGARVVPIQLDGSGECSAGRVGLGWVGLGMVGSGSGLLADLIDLSFSPID
jgi:2,5-diamino-6-(ribosylamino)-4(3H)-pyrimidinone 5'-phosphate reductase